MEPYAKDKSNELVIYNMKDILATLSQDPKKKYDGNLIQPVKVIPIEHNCT
jgi:hypothetical protein